MTRDGWIAGALALVLGGSQASAAEPVIVASAATEGELNDAVKQRLEDRLHEVLRKSDLVLIAVADEVEREAAACSDDACRARVVERNDARFLLVPEIRLADEDYHLRLTLYGPTGAELARLEETCGLCGLAEVADVMADLGARIGRKVDVATRASTLEVRSSPPGAKVFVADELVGTTPVELPIDAGVHELRVELDGYIALARTVELVAGEHESLELGLQPVPSEAPFEPERSRTRLFAPLGWTALALGVGAAAGGATLIALDERPITSDCSGTNVDAEGNCRWRYSTLEGGIALAATGAVAIGAGVALLVLSRKKSAPPASARVRLRPTVAGLGLSF